MTEMQTFTVQAVMIGVPVLLVAFLVLVAMGAKSAAQIMAENDRRNLETLKALSEAAAQTSPSNGDVVWLEREGFRRTRGSDILNTSYREVGAPTETPSGR